VGNILGVVKMENNESYYKRYLMHPEGIIITKKSKSSDDELSEK